MNTTHTLPNTVLHWKRERASQYVARCVDGSGYHIDKIGTHNWAINHRTYERDCADQSFTTTVHVGTGYWTLQEAKEAAERHAKGRNSTAWYLEQAQAKLDEAIKLVAHGSNAAGGSGFTPEMTQAISKFFLDSRELAQVLATAVQEAK